MLRRIPWFWRYVWLFFAVMRLTGCRAGVVDPMDAAGSGSGSETGAAVSASQVGSSSAAGGSSAVPLAPIVDTGQPLPSDGNYDFGPNVLIFEPTMNTQAMQAQLDTAFSRQEASQFGDGRYAYLFKPGAYNLDVQVGFYTTVHGLGASPDDVAITGGVRATAGWNRGNATTNFWRYVENLSTTPKKDGGMMLWAVSQASALRRVHVKGTINLWDSNFPSPNWSSGGFIADSVFDGDTVSGSQQQFLMRNNTMTQWLGGVWNMVFVGNIGSPAPSWPSPPYTIIKQTPVIREKPYLRFDAATKQYNVAVPPLRRDSQGASWSAGANTVADTIIPLNDFYMAHPNLDTAESMTLALRRGKHLLLTPGIYHLSRPIEINRAGAIVMGIGLATLTPDNGTSAVVIADVDDVTLAGVLLDAGPKASETMLELGATKTTQAHPNAPVALFDVSCRVGGARAGAADTCVLARMNDTLFDNVWLWRADHGEGAGWTSNPSRNGIIVSGDDVIAYGLFVEHFQEYQTIWRGERGRTYLYQSEIPYDVPNQAGWMNGTQQGFASYKVMDTVTTHEAQGLGVYCVFFNPVKLDQAIESPTGDAIVFNHMVTQWLGVDRSSGINRVYNGQGTAVDANHMSAYFTP